MYVTDLSIPITSNTASQQGRATIPLLLPGWSHKSIRLWGYGAFICMSLLSASFFPIAKPVLDRIDTSVFVALQMAWLLPPGCFLLIWSRQHINKKVMFRGVALGSCMGTGLLCLTLAMAYTSITETAMFSCMNGLIVVLISWCVFRQRVHFFTWLACLCSVGGIVVLLSISQMHWTGDLLAFVGGLLLTAYSFLTEKFCMQSKGPRQSRRAILGVECLTMAGEMLLYALLFGNWQSVTLVLPSDLFTFSYISLVTTLLPMATMMMMRPHVNGVTLTFITTLEPIAGATVAFFFVHERFPPLAYLGAALAVGSILFQAIASRISPPPTPSRDSSQQQSYRSPLYPGNMLQTTQERQHHSARRPIPLGRRARILLNQLWSAPNGFDIKTLQQTTGIPHIYVHRLLLFLQERGYVIAYCSLHEPKRYMLHSSWRMRPSFIQWGDMHVNSRW